MIEPEEPAKCRDCGLLIEAGNLVKGSLDAFADDEDYDLFCPFCDSSDIELLRPAEDR